MILSLKALETLPAAAETLEIIQRLLAHGMLINFL